MLNQGENESHCKFYSNYSKPIDNKRKILDYFEA